MKCPNCGFNSFDYLDECRKCKLPLNPTDEYKTLYNKVPGKTSDKTVDDSQSSDETIAQRELDNTGPEKTAEDTEPAADKDIPAFYKREQRRVLHSDADGGGPEHEVRSGGIKEINSNETIQKTLEEKPRAHKPDLRSDPGFEADVNAHAPDPVLYSESNVPQSATNSSVVKDSMEDSGFYNIAGLKLRAAAFAIDLVIVSFIAYLAIGAGFLLLGDTALTPKELGRVYLPIYALLFFLASTYFVFLHYYAGRTLGKMAVGIRIVSSDGKEIGLWESFMRWVGYYISAVFIFAGFIWSVFDRDSQAWHDKIAGTYVVIG